MCKLSLLTVYFRKLDHYQNLRLYAELLQARVRIERNGVSAKGDSRLVEVIFPMSTEL